MNMIKFTFCIYKIKRSATYDTRNKYFQVHYLNINVTYQIGFYNSQYSSFKAFCQHSSELRALSLSY